MVASAGAVWMMLTLVVADRMRGRSPLPVLVWLTAAARASFLLVPFVTSAWAFVAILVLATGLVTLAGPAQAAVVEAVYPRACRGRALSVVKMAGALAGMVATLVAGRLLGLVGFRWLFPLAGLIGVAGALRLRHLEVPPLPPHPPERRGTLRTAWAAVRDDVAFRRLLVASSLFGLGIWIQAPATPIMVADVLRATPAQLGCFASLGALGGLLASGGWGRLLDRYDSRTVLRMVYGAALLPPLVLLLARETWLLAVSTVAESVMVAGLDLVGIMALLDTAGRQRSAHYAAVATAVTGVRGLVGPLMGAALVDALGVRAVYLAAVACMLAGSWALGRPLPVRRAIPALRPAPLSHSPAAR